MFDALALNWLISIFDENPQNNSICKLTELKDNVREKRIIVVLQKQINLVICAFSNNPKYFFDFLECFYFLLKLCNLFTSGSWWTLILFCFLLEFRYFFLELKIDNLLSEFFQLFCLKLMNPLFLQLSWQSHLSVDFSSRATCYSEKCSFILMELFEFFDERAHF